jgi:hypothetical protein
MNNWVAVIQNSIFMTLKGDGAAAESAQGASSRPPYPGLWCAERHLDVH